ncbi:MAG: HPr family phosphocarrier protein [Victivallaceae bacterium]|nr:HPr family phosphocarrier protein [Victivallaceae bacterium]NLK84138.1 HPr family phosphocarrier protein [Lentisphaerota bacterium]MDD3116593.1 HPr family phosphocarrier protein [Victivallaceae bacterium]MDD3704296.1 HPr family phosphocarrier protein [Victivallaceae bacterium]MDD4317011.1 HPr family phosphocarrier protein [Victivallaceae bacterium]
MIEKTAKIVNQAGIHCRPSSVILNKIQEYPGCVFTVCPKGKDPVELNSILSLIALGLHCGDEVTIKAEGENEEIGCVEIARLFNTEFDFPPRQ